MEIGEKILELRKKMDLSQENLAELMGVARQTISKWELNETSPDLKDAKKLSKIFNVSLDEITNNDIKNVIVEKVLKEEVLLKRIINILKIMFLLIIITITILLFYVFCKDYFSVEMTNGMQSIECEIDNNKYVYEIYQNNETSYMIDKIITEDKNLKVDPFLYTNFLDVKNAIKKDVISRGGKCN